MERRWRRRGTSHLTLPHTHMTRPVLFQLGNKAMFKVIHGGQENERGLGRSGVRMTSPEGERGGEGREERGIVGGGHTWWLCSPVHPYMVAMFTSTPIHGRYVHQYTHIWSLCSSVHPYMVAMFTSTPINGRYVHQYTHIWSLCSHVFLFSLFPFPLPIPSPCTGEHSDHIWVYW